MSAATANLAEIADDFDVIIAGGGPAGSAAAIASARTGCAVLLIDRGVHPRNKVCGCCLAPAGIEVLARLEASCALDGAQPVSTVRLECGAQAMTVHRSGGVAIGRDALDESLLRIAAQRGCEILMGSIASFDPDGSVVVRQNGLVRTIRGRVCIAADGLQGSSLDHFPEFGWRVSKSSRMGFGAVVDGTALDLSREQILMRVHAGGYIGAVRLANGRIDIAAAAHPQVVRDAGGVNALAVQWLGPWVRTHAVLAAAAWKGTPLLTRRRSRLAGANVLIAGDAGGYVEPFTGEGMSWALATGAAAGNHASAIVHERASSKEWPTVANSIVRASRVRCMMTAHLLRHPMLLQAVMSTAKIFPAAADRIASAFGSELVAPVRIEAAS